MGIAFSDIYNDDERAELFTGRKQYVPEKSNDIREWMTVITHSDETSGRVAIIGDAVYRSDPGHRVTVRVREIVKEAKLEPVRYVSDLYRNQR